MTIYRQSYNHLISRQDYPGGFTFGGDQNANMGLYHFVPPCFLLDIEDGVKKERVTHAPFLCLAAYAYRL